MMHHAQCALVTERVFRFPSLLTKPIWMGVSASLFVHLPLANFVPRVRFVTLHGSASRHAVGHPHCVRCSAGGAVLRAIIGWKLVAMIVVVIAVVAVIVGVIA